MDKTTEVIPIPMPTARAYQSIYPYYRVTTYEVMEGQAALDLINWYQWFKSKKIPVALAHSGITMSKDYVAVWVIGVEHVDQHNLRYNKGNSEAMGDIVRSHKWPGRLLEEYDEKNNRL